MMYAWLILSIVILGVKTFVIDPDTLESVKAEVAFWACLVICYGKNKRGIKE